MPDIPTLAGIRQSYRVHEVGKQIRSSHGEARKGLTYIKSDRGPMGSWHETIGRIEGDTCRLCEGRSIRNGVYLLNCSRVADGKGMTIEQASEDVE